MDRRAGVLVALTFALGGLAGCAGPRLVEVGPQGGVVAIPENTNVWPTYYRDKAEALLQKKCPGGYDIVKEEEVVTGTVTNTNTRTDTQEAPTVVLAGANSTAPKAGKQGSASSALGGLAIPVGDDVQTTQQTTTSRNVTEWRIRYRPK